MRVEHHYMFWNKKTFEEVVKYVKNRKKYKDKEIGGFLILISNIIVKVAEDFQTYALITKAGLVQSDNKNFSSWEELDEILTKYDLDTFKGIWGKIIVEI